MNKEQNNNIIEGLKDSIKEMRLMRAGLKEKRTLDDLLTEIEQELEENV